MKYIIMCGGNYEMWKTPRHLTKIFGEEIVARTIRLLKQNGVNNIAISTNNPIFEKFNVPILKHENSYIAHSHTNLEGNWYDAFYPTDEPTCYLFGDVVFSPNAIKTIIQTKTDDIEFFASMPPFSKYYCKNHVEPFALKVVNTKHLKQAIEKTKQLDKQGKFWRKPIMWELWTVIKDVPLQTKPDEYIYNYKAINDYTIDVDKKTDAQDIENMIRRYEMVKCEVIKQFSFGRYNELQNIQRKSVDTEGKLYVGDKFDCSREIAEYLTGNNFRKEVVVKILEIIPEKVEEKVEEIEQPKQEKTKTTIPKTYKHKKTRKNT